MDVRKRYNWEIELKDGTVIREGDLYKFKFDDVIRCSFVPNIKLFPRHDIVFEGFKFKKRFARGFIKLQKGMGEYIHCVITDKFRVYIKSSNGHSIITDKDYELML